MSKETTEFDKLPEEEQHARLRDICHAITERLPEGTGFIILAFPFNREGNIRYASNARREDAVAGMKEWLIKASGPEEWMKRIN